MVAVAGEGNSLGLKGGCIILVDVPPASAITLDGITRVTPSSSSSPSSASSPTWIGASAPFGGLFIISNVCSTPSDHFHLLVVRSGTKKESNINRGECRTLPIGFTLGLSATTAPASEMGHEWVFARKYDSRTEEISSEPLDELTLKNLLMAMGQGGELGKFIITYDQFMGSAPKSNTKGNHAILPSWETRTSMINSRHLQRLHGLSHGNKIVPSSENDSDQSVATNNTNTVNSDNFENDGTSVSYPSIPCIDQRVNARQLAQHSGTRAYLSTLSPEKRTWLVMGGDSATAMDPGEFVWKDALSRYYGRGDATSRDSERDFLADVQLSFLLFLFLECHASLEHWRDAISMCSLSLTGASPNVVVQHPHFFQELLSILYDQLSCIETEFFREVEYSSGENNFMVGALRRICNSCESLGKRKRDGDTTLESLKSMSQKLRHMVHDRFGLELTPRNNNGDNDMDIDMIEQTAHAYYDGDRHDKPGINEVHDNQEEDDEDEDGPVIIPYNQIEASLVRSSLLTSEAHKRHNKNTISAGATQQSHCKEYPLLYAAKTPEEDEVMACARILDEAKDVSLVREAAAYLEEVEALRGGSF